MTISRSLLKCDTTVTLRKRSVGGDVVNVLNVLNVVDLMDVVVVVRTGDLTHVFVHVRQCVLPNSVTDTSTPQKTRLLRAVSQEALLPAITALIPHFPVLLRQIRHRDT